MPEAAQKVVVIQDASRSISSSAIKWAICGLSLKPGDELTLLGVLHQVNTPSTFPFMGAGKLMGYKSRVDTSSMLGANQKIIRDEVMRKELEYQNSTELVKISKLYEMNKIAFHKRVVPASSPKVAAFEAAKELGATWIILDRQMKKDKKYFMERLSCGISRMKSNNSVELLRGPKSIQKNGENSKGNQSRHVKNNEMLPGQDAKQGTVLMMQGAPLDDDDDDDDLFSLEIFPSNFKSTQNNSSNAEKGMDSGEGSLGVNSVTPSLSTSTSYEALLSLSTGSTSVQTNRKVSPGANFNDADDSSQFQEDNASASTSNDSKSKYVQSNCTIIIQNSAVYDDASASISNDSKSESVESNRIITQETGHEHINTPDDQDRVENSVCLTCEFTNEDRDRVENSVCSECRNRQPKPEFKKEFTYAELHAATDGFSAQNFLSEGGFGSVYKGRLKDGQWIAVKQHKHASMQGEKEFRSEVNVLSKARHKNVVMLLGSCSEGNHRLLVYEYISNGSLNIHLSKNNPNVLSWKNRMNIALGVARGLNFLHQRNIIHRDMRPNNILINHDYEPLLGDFGLAKAQQDVSDHSSENKVVGTFGYLAPEYAKRGRASTKTDVYSFGVVLLELITGHTTMDNTLAERSLVGWARPLLRKKKYPELIDERILDCHDVHELFWMVRVAERCLCSDPDKRPSMDKVEDALKCIMNEETASGVDDFSPAPSADSSFRGSNGSNSEHERKLEEHTITDVPSTSRSQMTLSIPNPMGHSSAKSLSEFLNSEGSKSGKGKNLKKGSRSLKIMYNEMLD